MARPTVQIIGAGPAGSSAAIAARQEGADVLLIEKSRFPRHKVCGEYLSPEVLPVLRALGAWDSILEARPAVMRRLILHFRSSEKRCMLPESAFGLSRYCLDQLLFNAAIKSGARNQVEPLPEPFAGSTVLAYGRKNASPRGNRLFGFKAHFTGPANDAVELFFFDGCYVGVNAVEDGITNVCGLGPENILSRFDFDMDAVVASSKPLANRLEPLARQWKWLTTGPLVFQNAFRSGSEFSSYPAGDALSFVDPFTGSGMLSALTTGRLAGIAAARGTPVHEYIDQCRRRLERPYQFSALFRGLLANGWGEGLAGLVPGQLLVWLTRPHGALSKLG